MKKLLLVVVLVLLSLSVIACGPSVDISDDSDDSNIGTIGGDKASSNKLGDYEVEILSARFSTSYDDKEVVVITYKFVNNGDEAAAFYTAIEETVYQDGVECERCYSYDGEIINEDNGTKEIKSGKSIEIEYGYYLNDASDIEVECKEWLSFSDKKITKTFKYDND